MMTASATEVRSAVRRLMTGPVWVSYGQVYVESSDEDAGLEECFGGQRNGLCGAAIAGRLFLITGLHTGYVGFAVESYDEPPPVGDSWEEIVEVSFRPASEEVALVGWAGEGCWPLDLRCVDYRVRYCGRGMDAVDLADSTAEDDPPVDRYLLQFWPAPPDKDRVVRQTSAKAAYWHEFARTQPPPPPPGDRAETERRAAAAREQEHARWEQEEELGRWGGVLPGEAVRELSWAAVEVARLDRPVLDAIDRADGATRRAVARWAARRALAEAQLTDLDWIASALAALDSGDRLPEYFRDLGRTFERAWSDDRMIHTTITTLDGLTGNVSQQAVALPAIAAAAAEDALKAAVETIRIGANTFGYGGDRQFFAELRRAFPQLWD